MEIAGSIVLLFGALTFSTAGLGLLRFPDVYTRASAVATASGVGLVLIVMGAVLLQPSWSNGVKAIAIVVLQLITSAVGSMAISRSAYLIGVPLARSDFDELSDPPGVNNGDDGNGDDEDDNGDD